MDGLQIDRAGERLAAAFRGDEDVFDALEAVSLAAGAKGAAIIPLDPANDVRPFSRAVRDLAEAYDSYWHRHDFRYASLGKMLREGVAVDQDIVTPEAMGRMPYYAEFLAPRGLRWFAGIPFRDGATAWCMAIQRTPAQGPFEAHEQAVVRRLGCALSQSVSTARRLAAAHEGGLVDGLAAAGSEALLLDRGGRVVEASGRISGELRRELGAEIGEVLLARSSRGKELKSRIEAALHPDLAADDFRRLPMILRRAGRRPLVLRVRSLRGEGARFFDRAAIMVIVDDLSDGGQQPLDVLRHAFELTPAQARIAAAIGAGRTVKASAEELGIGVETVRSGLQKVFEKVGVARQAELVQVLSRLRRH